MHADRSSYNTPDGPVNQQQQVAGFQPKSIM